MNSTEKFYAANEYRIEAIMSTAFANLPPPKGFCQVAYGLFQLVRKQAPSHARLTIRGKKEHPKVSAAALAAHAAALKKINEIKES